MDEFDMKKAIYCYVKEICHFSQMQVFATSDYQQHYFQLQIDETASDLVDFFLRCNRDMIDESKINIIQQQNQQGEKMQTENQTENQTESQTERVREFTREELANYDGVGGREAYVAVNGTVYDVTMILRWAGGSHFGLYAGRDLSKEFMGCHQGVVERLKNIPVIGKIRD